jgi:hypothetical protein
MSSSSGTGLCPTCIHARTVTSARGSVFLLCGRNASDPRFPKYPRLPVIRCVGYEPRDDTPRADDAEASD